MTDNREHSPLGASSAYRWIACPGSVREAAKYENVSSVYAAEGTAAHTLAAHCLEHGGDAEDHIGRYVDHTEVTREQGDPQSSFEITDEMAEAVQVYLDFCRSAMGDGVEHEIEQRFDLSEYHDGMFGTADFVAYDPVRKHLTVADYKHGKGKAVEVKENPQLLYYAFGAASRYHNRPLETIEIVVVQPRKEHPKGPVRRWSTDPAFLLDWLGDLLAAAKRTEEPDAPLIAGDWCTDNFCPAASGCPAARQRVIDSAIDDFTESGAPIVKEVTKASIDDRQQRMREINFIEDWCRRVREFEHHEAEAGRCLPGYKLVPTRPKRVFKDEDEIRQFLALNDVSSEDMFEDPKFRSVAKMETMLKDKYGYKGKGNTAKAFLSPYVDSVSSGTVLAPINDPREPVRSEAEEDFT